MVQAGIENCLAISGTAFTDGHATILKRFSKNIFITFDGDAADIGPGTVLGVELRTAVAGDPIDDDQMVWDDDNDGDGTPDDCDDDADNDGSFHFVDSDDNDEYICSDDDGDGCDDCSNGIYDTASECNITIEIDLNEGSNLISFYALPDNVTLENIFNDNAIIGVLIQGLGAIRIDGQWYGSLTEINQDKGYWVKVSENISITLEDAEPINYDFDGEVIYNLSYGNNLLSYPYADQQTVSDGIGIDNIILLIPI